MFHFDNGLKLTKADLAIDVRRRQPRAYISHAHSDHMARHQYALCTPETARLYHLRMGRRDVREMPYRCPIEWGGLRLTTFPAGHCLGSAVLLAEDGGESLLYTGDFKLGESATAQRAELPHADILVIESTYGDPAYRLPPRHEVLERFFSLIRDTLRTGATPVIAAYALGKSQEVTRLLTDEGFRVAQHAKVFEVSRVYEECGVSLGRYRLLSGTVDPGEVVIVPPGHHRGRAVEHLGRIATFAVTGWAVGTNSRWRLGVDQAVPLSDHADYDELFEAVQRVSPRVVYCTHGPASFVDRLRERGIDAHPLDGRAHRQKWLPF